MAVTDEAKLAYLAYLAQEDKAAAEWVRTLRNYALGQHPTYLTERQKEFIGLLAKDSRYLYAHNLCALVIAAAVERLVVTGFAPVEVVDARGERASEAASAALAEMVSQWWEANRMDATQDELYEAACRDGEAYLIVDWHDDAPRWTLNLKFDGTQGVKVHRDPDTDGILFASKRWQTYDPLNPGQTGRTRLTLYWPDRVEKYIQSSSPNAAFPQAGWDKTVDGQNEPWPIPWLDGSGQSLGMAVVPFENPGGSEIGDLIPVQDMLNKSDLDLIAAADSAGFRIFWASGVSAEIDPATGNEKKLTVSPGHMIRLSQPNSQVGAIEPVDLERLITTSKYWIESVAGITRTPQYLFQAQGAEQPSGESLKMQEIGLVAKAQRKQKVFGNAWEDALYLSARLWNLYRPGETLAETRLQTQWKDPATRNELQHLQALVLKQQIGVSTAQVLREAGYDEATVAQMQAEKEAASASVADQLLRAVERDGANGRA